MESYDVVGTPTERWIWLAPDWSAQGTVQKDKSWVHVKVRDVKFKDGRIVTYVLDADGNPVAPGGAPAEGYQQAQPLDQTIDDKQQASAAQAQTQTKAPNGQQYARGADGTINEWNPNSNPPGYNIPHPEMTPAAAIQTPDQKRETAAMAAADEAKAADAKRVADESAWNANPANIPNGASGRYETHADRDARLAKEKIDADARARQQTIDAQNAATAASASRRADSAEARAVAEANRVGSNVENLTINGQRYTRITKTSADGKTTSVENYGPDGAQVATLPAEQTGTPAEPAGAPPASVQYGAIMASQVKYRDFLNQQVIAKNLTPDQADKLMAVRLAQNKATMEEQQGVVNTQTGIYGQQVSQQNQQLREAESRRNAAGTAYSAVMQNFLPLIKYMPRGGGQAFADLINGNLAAAMPYAAAWGGMAAPAAPQLGPAAAVANSAALPGQGGAVPSPAPGTAAAPATPTQGTFLAPYDPAAEAAKRADLEAANAAAQGSAQPASSPPSAPLLPPPPLVQGQDLSTPPAGGINPAVGDPGNDPSRPVGMLPSMPSEPVAQSFLSPYQQQQPQPSGLEQMLADSWMPNNILARAYRDVHGVDHPQLGYLAA